MLFVATITLITIGGALGRCASREQEQCNYETVPQDFPGNVEELWSGCNAFLNFSRCVLNVSENCNDSTENCRKEKELISVRQMKDFLEENCNASSVTYTVLSENIECASPVLNTVGSACELESISQRRMDVKTTHEQDFRWRFPEKDIERCLGNVWDVICAAATVSDECGSQLLTPLTDAMTNLNYELLVFCPEDIIDDIPAYSNSIFSAGSDS